jgi:hypothetical protein
MAFLPGIPRLSVGLDREQVEPFSSLHPPFIAERRRAIILLIDGTEDYDRARGLVNEEENTCIDLEQNSAFISNLPQFLDGPDVDGDAVGGVVLPG